LSIIEAVFRRAIRHCQRDGFSMDEIRAGVAIALASPEQEERRGPKVIDDDDKLREMHAMIYNGFAPFTAARIYVKSIGTPHYYENTVARRLDRKYKKYMSRWQPSVSPVEILATVTVDFPVSFEISRNNAGWSNAPVFRASDRILITIAEPNI
jgi:hypothetical protein